MAHAMAHALGAIYHVPHGRAVGILLPYTIEYIAAEAPERFAEVANVLGCYIGEPVDAAMSLAANLRQLCVEIGNPTSIAELGIEREMYMAQVEDLLERAFNDASMMTAARSPSYEELQQIYEYAYNGKPIDF
jgi:alcohol dehydrogenase class IV